MSSLRNESRLTSITPIAGSAPDIRHFKADELRDLFTLRATPASGCDTFDRLGGRWPPYPGPATLKDAALRDSITQECLSTILLSNRLSLIELCKRNYQCCQKINHLYLLTHYMITTFSYHLIM